MSGKYSCETSTAGSQPSADDKNHSSTSSADIQCLPCGLYSEQDSKKIRIRCLSGPVQARPRVADELGTQLEICDRA